jgi:hypothetical protein
VIYIRGLTARIIEFVKLAGRRISLDNRTRWNSWYLILTIALTLRSVVNKYCQNYELDLEDDELILKDWRQLRIIKEFLEPFYDVTLYTKGDCAAIN